MENLIYWPNPILNQKSRLVSDEEFNTIALERLVEDLFETMYAKNGVGLAAVQVGRPIQVFVMDCTKCPDQEENNYLAEPIALINPTIESFMGPLVKVNEGCLSFPGVWEEVNRYQEVIVNFRNLKGEPRRYQFVGTEAQCVAHEIEHLNGVTMGDGWGRVKRDIAKRKINKNK